jgi:hypothetical protein
MPASELDIFEAVSSADMDKVQPLITDGCNLNQIGTIHDSRNKIDGLIDFKGTPLHIAVYNDDADMTALLLLHGANPNPTM